MHITVSNLAPSVTAHALRQLFAPYGAVGIIHIMINRMSGCSQGYGSVAMPDRQAAQTAIAALHGTALAGWVLTVHAAQPGEHRGLSRSSPGGSSRTPYRSYGTEALVHDRTDGEIGQWRGVERAVHAEGNGHRFMRGRTSM
jgi:RNA recognition motif-containing protein